MNLDTVKHATVNPPHLITFSTTTCRAKGGGHLRRYISKIFVSLVAVVAVMAAMSNAQAQIPVNVQVDAVELETSAIDTVPIVITGADGIVAMHVEITYDPAVLQWDSLENGNLLSSNSLVEVNPDIAGTVIVGIATLDPVSGTGPLLLPRFSVLGVDGATATVGLQNVAAWDENGFDVLIQTQDQNLAIAGGSGLPILLIALIVGAVVIIGIAAWLMKGRRTPPAVSPGSTPATVGPAPGAAGSQVSVNQPVTLLDSQQNPVGQLQPGQFYTVMEENAGWYAATDAAGNSGWVSATMVNW